MLEFQNFPYGFRVEEVMSKVDYSSSKSLLIGGLRKGEG